MGLLRCLAIIALTNIVLVFPLMKEQFMTTNLVGRMFKTVDFVSLPLSDSATHLKLATFLLRMFTPIADDEATQVKQYRLIRVSVFEPAKHYITFIIHNSHKLVLEKQDTHEHERRLYLIHNRIKNLELRSDEHDANFVSELVKWEVRTMVEMEDDISFIDLFHSMLSRTWEWNQDKRERQKRREVRLREDGWDDCFELRVIGINASMNWRMGNRARLFRKELKFNADEEPFYF
ncbi:hypothetical protein BLNAU_7121 [Blattamonas nauphoetae]|uniref:Uncharacterized protein n=1 Tax=Blattamonas nauphoetae TaxID=2049346 RepID=A0ABQ9Y2H0_9EUKA|nr:hypothetical protein BLNAU_7121 [Blattamonas nauphoetae]